MSPQTMTGALTGTTLDSSDKISLACVKEKLPFGKFKWPLTLGEVYNLKYLQSDDPSLDNLLLFSSIAFYQLLRY